MFYQKSMVLFKGGNNYALVIILQVPRIKAKQKGLNKNNCQIGAKISIGKWNKDTEK